MLEALIPILCPTWCNCSNHQVIKTTTLFLQWTKRVTSMHCFFSLWSMCISLSTTWQSWIEMKCLLATTVWQLCRNRKTAAWRQHSKENIQSCFISYLKLCDRNMALIVNGLVHLWIINMAEVEFCITNTLDQRRYHGVRYGTFCPKRGHPGLGQIVWGDILPYYTRITKKSTAWPFVSSPFVSSRCFVVSEHH